MSRFREIQAARIDEIAQRCEALVRPRRSIGLADWGHENRELTSATAGKTGRYDVSVTPWMREIYDCMHPDSGHDFVAVMKCQQSGLTELGLTWLAYTLVEDPGPWLVVQPTLPDVKAFVQTRVKALRESTPALPEPTTGDADNLALMTFPGSVVRFGNAGSKGSLSSQPVRYVLLDEASKYPTDTQGGGDPIAMARGRTTTFKTTRKILMISTPELAGACAMERAFENGDQRKYHVPCPHCGVMQELVYEQLTDAAQYECGECGELIDENRHKTQMLDAGEWIPSNPGGLYPSFHVSGLMRPLSWDGWAEVVREMRAARTPQERKAATNLQLGLPFQETEAHAMEPVQLLERRETYHATCPSGVVVLTAGVDVQADRLEVYVYGWGVGEEWWLIDRQVIRGRPQSSATWAELERVLSAKYEHQTAVELPIAAACVDSGYQTQTVYEWAAKWHGRRRWYAIMGSHLTASLVWPKKPSRKKLRNQTGRVLLYNIGATAAKEVLLSRLMVQEPGPEYLHLPEWAPLEGYAEQILSEHRTVDYTSRRKVEVRYTLPPGRRNEALDCTVYAYAAFKSLEADGIRVDRVLETQCDIRQTPKQAETPAPKPEPKPQPAPSRWGSSVGQAWQQRPSGWRR